MKTAYLDYVLTLVFYTVFYSIGIVICVLILIKKVKDMNCTVGCYACTMFFFGFLMMAAGSGALAEFENIDIEDINEACDASVE